MRGRTSLLSRRRWAPNWSRRSISMPRRTNVSLAGTVFPSILMVQPTASRAFYERTSSRTFSSATIILLRWTHAIRAPAAAWARRVAVSKVLPDVSTAVSSAYIYGEVPGARRASASPAAHNRNNWGAGRCLVEDPYERSSPLRAPHAPRPVSAGLEASPIPSAPGRGAGPARGGAASGACGPLRCRLG